MSDFDWNTLDDDMFDDFSVDNDYFNDILYDDTDVSSKEKIKKMDIKLFKHQDEFVNSEATFPALIGGFGCGKTEAGIIRTMKHMLKYGPELKKQGRIYMFGVYEPTYDLIETVLYERFEAIIQDLGYQYVLNKSNRTIKFPKLGTIKFINMSDPSKIVGYQHGGCWIDELDTLPGDKAKEVWRKIIERNRLTTSGENSISVTTTPEGFRFMWEFWEKNIRDIKKKEKLSAEDKQYLEKYIPIKGHTEDNIYLKQSYFDSLRLIYPADKLNAYMAGEFMNLEGHVVYDSFDMKRHLSKGLEYTFEDVHIGMDFNVGKMSAVITHIRNGKIEIIDEIYGVDDTPAMIEEIMKKDIGGNIFIYPDASGKNTKSSDASISDIILLRKARFIVKAKLKNPRVKDRVLSVNAMFNQNRIAIDDKCENLISNLNQQVYNKKGEPDKESGQDHMLDALGYLVYFLFPIKKKEFTQVDIPT